MVMDASEFSEFVAALPPEYEIALTAENVSTAFYHARRAGWSVEQLVGDAVSTLGRGGVGLVVTRMTALAQSSPTKREQKVVGRQQAMPLPECSYCGQPYSRRSRVVLGTTCVSCGEALVLRQHQGGE